MSLFYKIAAFIGAALCMLLLYAMAAQAQTAASTTWAHWTDGTLVPARVNGTLDGMAVSFEGSGPMLDAYSGLPGQPKYWQINPATYTGGPVINAPTTSDAIRLQGPGAYLITFSRPVTDPVMGILSLGGIATVTLNFGVQPVVLLKTGPGAWGAGTPLVIVGNTIVGKEGSGLVQFPGTFSSLSFSADVMENWWGFTLGLVSAAPPPPIAGPGPSANLQWDYMDEDILVSAVLGFRIYEGSGQQCDQPEPLLLSVGEVPASARTFDRIGTPIADGVLCYEATAFNTTGESAHSNRASAQAADLIPAAPTGLRVEVLSQE